MMNDDDVVVVSGASGREAVEELRRSGALDALFERLDAGEVEMTGSEGLLPALLKEALERGLAAELTEHLGYEKGQASGQARSNTRNGTTKKTVMSEVGAFEIEVPRDRAGSFTPRLVRKGQRRLDGLDSMIISLYAGGMAVRDIRHHLASTIGVEVSGGGRFPRSLTRCATPSQSGSTAPPRSVLPGDLPGRDPHQNPTRSHRGEPGRSPGGGSGHGGRQACAGHLGPSR